MTIYDAEMAIGSRYLRRCLWLAKQPKDHREPEFTQRKDDAKYHLTFARDMRRLEEKMRFHGRRIPYAEAA
jgi:hypothetical protein